MTRRVSVAMTAPLPVGALVRDAYATVSDNLPELIRLGRGPFVVALALALLIGASQSFGSAPAASLVTLFAFAWFSFSVMRLVLLGPARATLPAPAPDGEDDGRWIPRSALGTYMGRATGLAVLALAGVGAVLAFVVTPLTVLPLQAAAGAEPAAGPLTGNLVLAAALAAWPVGVPLARLAVVLPPTALGRETGLGAAWSLSRGHGLRLGTALVVLILPYLLGYGALHAALAMLAAATGGSAGPVAHVLALLLVTAMGLTASALAAVALTRAWCAMTGETAAVPVTAPDISAPPR